MRRGTVLFGILILALLLCAAKCTPVDPTGGTIAEWENKILNSLGPDSIEFRTLMECENGMQVKVEECLAYEGWMVDNILSITDFKTNKNYEVEDMRTGGCEGLGENDTRPFTADSRLLDTQRETRSTSFQVICQIACYSWPCKKAGYNGTTPVGKKYTLSVKKTGSGSGIVSGDTIICGDRCSAEFGEGEQVILTAEPEEGSIFLGWEGACTGTDDSCYIDMQANKEATAIFGKASIQFNPGICTLNNVDQFGDHHWTVDVSGTATAPEGFELSFGSEVSGYETPVKDCDSWGDSDLQICKRDAGQPETTGFSHKVSDMTERPDFRDSSYKYLAVVRLFYKNNLVTEEQEEFQCPA